MRNAEPTLYEFEFVGGWDNKYTFITNGQIGYNVRFKPSADYVSRAEPWRDDFYEIVIEVASAPDLNRIATDQAVFPTIIAIITDFFTNHERVILYVCDDSDSRELARKRKFDQWYTLLGTESYEKYDLPTVAEDTQRLFVSVLFRRDNPHRYAIIDAFRQVATGEK